jgi:hypothetical protein
MRYRIEIVRQGREVRVRRAVDHQRIVAVSVGAGKPESL